MVNFVNFWNQIQIKGLSLGIQVVPVLWCGNYMVQNNLPWHILCIKISRASPRDISVTFPSVYNRSLVMSVGLCSHPEFKATVHLSTSPRHLMHSLQDRSDSLLWALGINKDGWQLLLAVLLPCGWTKHRELASVTVSANLTLVFSSTVHSTENDWECL